MEAENIKTLKTLFNRTTLLNHATDAKIVALSTKELILHNELIKYPLIQTTLNDDKVEEMKEKYSDDNMYKHHFLACCMITIAHLIVGDKEDYYLVDGQHRLNMAFDLLNTKNENKSFLVSIINVKSKQEMDELFKKINADSTKCNIIDWPIFAEQMYMELKNLFIEKYKFTPKSSSTRNKLYNISEFINMMIKDPSYGNIITIKGDNSMKVFSFLKKKEKEFFNMIDYLSKLHQNRAQFKEQEIHSIENQSCMFMKNNNFLEWLKDNTIIPEHDFRTRVAIPKALQKQVWEKEFNATTNGKCPIYNCTNILDKKVSNSWQCGHIISVMNGGTNDIDNLRPICTPCNKSMSSMDWDIYVIKVLKDTIIEDYYNDNDTLQCYYKNSKRCTIMINKDEFFPYVYQTKAGKTKLKPICKKCFDNNNI